jgi:sodium/potassium-transporting ATPase subunit alpha
MVIPANEFPPNFAFDSEDVQLPLNGFRFVGLISLMDPPRAAVPDTVS